LIGGQASLQRAIWRAPALSILQSVHVLLASAATGFNQNEAWARKSTQLPIKHYSDYRIEILTSRIESNVSGADDDYRSMAA
jgi:hypothetical protein